MADRKTKKEEMESRLVSGNYKVYMIIRHVSRSGMTRIIDPIVFLNDGTEDNFTCYIGVRVAEILGLKYQCENFKPRGVKVTGWGMDMAFDLVSKLSRELYGDDYKLRSIIL